jgi:hypothetical protein
MILYEKQLVNLEKYNEPGIFLGYDADQTSKIWVIRLDEHGSPYKDWFYENAVDYYHVTMKNEALPGKRAIAFGKFKQPSPLVLFTTEPTEDEIKAYGDYLNELKTKNKDKNE